MYFLHLADRLADAALQYQSFLEVDPGGPANLVIVQSAHMQRWLSRFLAQRSGIWFQPPFATPDGGLRSILKDMQQPETQPKRQCLFMDDLKYLSFRSLGRLVQAADFHERFPLLDQMLRGNQTKQSIPKASMYQLADAISGLFYNYSQLLWSLEQGREADTHIFDLWLAGRSLLTESRAGSVHSDTEFELEKHEDWQRQLFLAMFPPDRTYDISGYQVHRSNAEGWRYDGNLKRLVLFGSAFLSSQAFAFYRNLAEQGLEIHHILLTPSPDLPRLGQISNPLLREWGGLIEPFFSAAAAAPAQVNIDSNFDLAAPAIEPIFLKAGFRSFSCTTPWREVESLKQNLLSLMAESRDGGQPLLPQDIAIMAPDIRLYGPYLESIFTSISSDGSWNADHLPLNLVDLDFGLDTAVVTALMDLLGLAASRLERSQILELLDNPAIQQAIGIEEPDVALFREWSSHYFVQWGLNAHQRERLQAGASWSNTLDRGLQMLFADLSAGAIQVSNSELAVIGRIAEFLHRNVTLLAHWTSQQKTLAEWVRELQDLMDRSIKPPSPAETRIFDQLRAAAGNLLNFANDLGDASIVNDSIDWIGFQILFQDQIAHLSGSRGHHQIDGITCSSLRPYRAIPFRLIAILGMNESSLPRPDEQFSFDLSRLEKRSQGLISRKLTDKYAWLETVVSAQEWLWVFYQGRDPSSPEILQPASMVTETIEYLAQTGLSAAELQVQEPILNFSPDYFTPAGWERGLRNLDAKILTISQEWLQAPESMPEPASQLNDAFSIEPGANDSEFLHGKQGDGLHLSIKELSDFLVSPPRSYARKRLGVYLDSGDAESLADLENLDPPFWLDSQILQTIAPSLTETSVDQVGNEVIAQLARSGEVYPSPFASLALDNLIDGLTRVKQPLAALGDDSVKIDVQEIEIDRTIQVQLSPDQVGPAAGEYTLRLGGKLKNLWRINGELTYVIISKSNFSGPGSIKIGKYLEAAVALSLCRGLNLELPTTLLHISTNPGTPEAKILMKEPIPPATETDLSFNQLVQAWMVNLVKPLPFYEIIMKEFAKTEADPTEMAKLWQEVWSEIRAEFNEPYPPIGNPRSCPNFQLLTPGGEFIPAWKDWYSSWIGEVWRPAHRFRYNFVKETKRKGKKA